MEQLHNGPLFIWLEAYSMCLRMLLSNILYQQQVQLCVVSVASDFIPLGPQKPRQIKFISLVIVSEMLKSIKT